MRGNIHATEKLPLACSNMHRSKLTLMKKRL